jgi:UDP-N-acetylmuramoyl-L-alanyl-D-glutamate--2,6-diaminopimelate ligase
MGVSLKTLAECLELSLAPPAGRGGLANGETPEDVIITNISEDSRDIESSWLFVAIKGEHLDGKDFIEDALAKGSKAVMLEGWSPKGDYFTLIAPEGSDLRLLATKAARIIYGYPDESLITLGITGTNGKSTTASLMESVLKALNLTPGLIGTVDYHLGDKHFPAPNTTPEGPLLFRTIYEMKELGAKSLVMEVSSHGLAQDRVHGILFDYALFTNLSRDHLDFHKDFEDYFQAKLLLFQRHLKNGGVRAAINQDDPYGEKILAILGERALGYGFQKGELRGRILEEGREGLVLEINHHGSKLNLRSKLLGSFNAENLLSAFALSSLMVGNPEEGLPLKDLTCVIKALEASTGAPGRLSRVSPEGRFLALVDYAHSPAALEKAINASQKLVAPGGRLILIFGCGGDRDRGKRPLMGKAASIADIPILTSDNPRTEDPLQIMADAEPGLMDGGLKHGDIDQILSTSTQGLYLMEPDRKKAIEMGVRILNESDVLLICGKGHEDYQIIGRKKFPFDDSVVALKALKELGKA